MTANHPEDLVARLTARASSANGNGRPAGGYWPDDAELDRQAASTIRNRDETIAALRAALRGLLRCEYESAGHGLMDCIDNQGSHYQSQYLADQIKRAEALASPHQEGTGT